MEIKVIHANSIEEAVEALKTIHKQEASKEAERGSKEANAYFDKFIDLSLDLVEHIVDCGSFTRDCEVFRKHIHDAPILIKRSFYKNFSAILQEFVSDIMGIVGEYAIFHTAEKKCSDDKGKETKGKEKSQPKVEKKNSSSKKKSK